MVLVDRARVEVEDVRDHRDLAARAGDRLADVPRLDPGQLLGVLLDEGCQPPQQARAIGDADGAPGRERRSRARDGGVHLLDAGLLELGDRLLRGRIHDRQRHDVRSRRKRRASLTRAAEQLRALRALRMPEHAERESLAGILDSLDHPVGRPAGLLQPMADAAERLMVLARDDGPRAEQLGEARSLARADLVHGRVSGAVAVELGPAVPLGQILDDVAAAQHVEQLRAPADREQRQIELERAFEQRELGLILLGADSGRRRMLLGAVERRVDVDAARHDQTVQAVEGLDDRVRIGWELDRTTAGARDGSDVGERRQRAERAPVAPAHTLDERGHADHRLLVGHRRCSR